MMKYVLHCLSCSCFVSGYLVGSIITLTTAAATLKYKNKLTPKK